MAFKKGQPKPAGSGIKKGQDQPRKTTVREIIEAAVGRSIPERLMELCRSINDERFEADVMLDLMPYCYPKMQAIEVTATATVDVNDQNVQTLVMLLDKMNADSPNAN